jgi:hypothetical protein
MSVLQKESVKGPACFHGEKGQSITQTAETLKQYAKY